MEHRIPLVTQRGTEAGSGMQTSGHLVLASPLSITVVEGKVFFGISGPLRESPSFYEGVGWQICLQRELDSLSFPKMWEPVIWLVWPTFWCCCPEVFRILPSDFRPPTNPFFTLALFQVGGTFLPGSSLVLCYFWAGFRFFRVWVDDFLSFSWWKFSSDC